MPTALHILAAALLDLFNDAACIGADSDPAMTTESPLRLRLSRPPWYFLRGMGTTTDHQLNDRLLHALWPAPWPLDLMLWSRS